MKKAEIIIGILLGFAILITSCNKDEGDKANSKQACPTLESSEVPMQVKTSYDAYYPATDAKVWYLKDGKMYVAYIEKDSKEMLVYFDLEGNYLGSKYDTDNDGKFDEWGEKPEISCDELTTEELSDKVTACLMDKMAYLEKESDEISAYIEELENMENNGGCSDENLDAELIEEKLTDLNLYLEELEMNMNELAVLLEEIETGEIDEDHLCELFKQCAWGGKEENCCDCCGNEEGNYGMDDGEDFEWEGENDNENEDGDNNDEDDGEFDDDEGCFCDTKG